MNSQSDSPISLLDYSEPLLSISSPGCVQCQCLPQRPADQLSTHPKPSISSQQLPLRSELCRGDTSPGHCDGLNIARGLRDKRKHVHAQGTSFKLGEHYRVTTTINVLPNNVLLEIFDLCRSMPVFRYGWRIVGVWKWHTLVHVCQRWRHIIFASPIRLNLRILCTYGTPVRKSLNIWPNFPLVIGYDRADKYGLPFNLAPTDEDNVFAALEHPNRVCDVRLRVMGPQLGRIAMVMQEPFPALRYLLLGSTGDNVPVLPGEFLGSSAPRLQQLSFHGVPFPSLPILLPSASDLITLILSNIPQTGYISPEAMVTGLATLTRLRDLSIGFRSPNSRPDRIYLPPITRTVLPALTSFEFRGVCEYLEDFVARIDAPRLHSIRICYLNQLVDFDVPQLSRIIDHSEALKRPWRCFTVFRPNCLSFVAFPNYPPKSDDLEPHVTIKVSILCEGIDWQVSHLARVLGQISTVTSNVIHFTIELGPSPIMPKREDENNIEWLQLLSLFSSVRTLIVPEPFAGHVSRALEDSAGMIVTEVLPALDILFLEGQSVSSIDKFIAARRDSDRPVTIAITEAEFRERQHSYQQETREVA